MNRSGGEVICMKMTWAEKGRGQKVRAVLDNG